MVSGREARNQFPFMLADTPLQIIRHPDVESAALVAHDVDVELIWHGQESELSVVLRFC
jgi:hypothetical protein